MTPNHAPGFGDAPGGELRPASGFIRDQAGFAETFEHPRDGRGADVESCRNLDGRHQVFRAAEAMDRFQVILDCSGGLLWHPPVHGRPRMGRVWVGTTSSLR